MSTTSILRPILMAALVSASLAHAAPAQQSSAAQPNGAGVACPHMGPGPRGAVDAAPMPGFMPMHGPGLEKLLSRIDASASQKEQIARIQAQVRPELDKLHAEGQALREQAAQLWTAPTLDERAIEQSSQKMAMHHEQVSQRMTRFMLDVAKVLTPEQRAKVAEQMQSRREHMRHRFGGERPQK